MSTLTQPSMTSKVPHGGWAQLADRQSISWRHSVARANKQSRFTKLSTSFDTLLTSRPINSIVMVDQGELTAAG